MDTGATAVGLIGGAKLGALAGSVLGPPGAAIGGIIGTVLGSLVGRQVAQDAKREPLRQAAARHEAQLSEARKAIEHSASEVMENVRETTLAEKRALRSVIALRPSLATAVKQSGELCMEVQGLLEVARSMCQDAKSRVHAWHDHALSSLPSVRWVHRLGGLDVDLPQFSGQVC